MAKINTKILRQELGKNRAIIEYAYNLANQDFEEKKQQLLQEFDNHPVTEEIKDGSQNPLGAANITQTTEGRGNLYTFIGFDVSDPISPVREVLEKSTNLKKTSLGARYEKDAIVYNFPIETPSFDGELANAAPMPWGSSISWLRAVEKGISGLNSYIYWKAKGRSGGGIQAQNSDGSPKEIRGLDSDSKPIRYLSTILTNFIKSFR